MKFVKRDLGPTDDASRGKADLGTWIKNALSVVITLGLLYLILGVIADVVATQIPESMEARFAFFKYPDPIKTDPDFPLFKRAKGIFKKLSKDQNLKPLPYHIYIMNHSIPNAFSFPWGTIKVTKVLLTKIESEVGLAMVIGHELGHHHHRHALKRMGRTLLYYSASAMLFGSDPSAITKFPLKMANLGHGRNQETEADEFGLRLVYQVYGSCDKVFEFFEMIRTEGFTADSRWTAMLSTHPFLPDRIKHLHEYRKVLEKSEVKIEEHR